MNPLKQFPDPLRDEVLRTWQQFVNSDTPSSFYHHFRNDFLRLNPKWWRTYQLVERSFNVGGETYWATFITFKITYRYVSATGVGVSKGRAKDVCAYRLYLSIERYFPQYQLPPYIVGFPNARGHCFLISALIPVLHSYPFVKKIFDAYSVLSRSRNGGVLEINPTLRRDPEVPYYWINALFELYVQYYKVSAKRFLAQHNIARLCLRIERQPNVFLPYVGDRGDIDLDHALVGVLCSSLRDFCNNFYATPGGWEHMAFADLMYKLASQDSTWVDEFFLKFEADYFCGRCTNEMAHNQFHVPLLKLCPGYGFQDLIENLDTFLSVQDIHCDGLLAGQRCHGKIRRVHSGRILNVPKVLCFFVPMEDSFDRITVPEFVRLPVMGEGNYYRRLASTNCIQCWKSAAGFDYGHFYHPRQPGDVYTGGHTYVTIRTDKGFVESNNGFLYTCDTRLFGYTTLGSIHYYQLCSYDDFVPYINVKQVRNNPMY